MESKDEKKWSVTKNEKKPKLPSNFNDYQHLLGSGVSTEDTVNWVIGLRDKHVSPKISSPNGSPSFQKENPSPRNITHNLHQSIVDHPHLRRQTGSMGELVPITNKSQFEWSTGLRNASELNTTRQTWDYSPVKTPRHGRFLPPIKNLVNKKTQVYKNPKLQYDSDFNAANKSQEKFDDRRSAIQFSTDRHLMGRNFRVDTNNWAGGLRSNRGAMLKPARPQRLNRSTDTQFFYDKILSSTQLIFHFTKESEQKLTNSQTAKLDRQNNKMGCWETVDKSGFYSTDQRKLEQKLVALRRQMKQEELTPPRRRHRRNSRNDRTRPSKNDLYTEESPSIIQDRSSQGSEDYWRSLTPELSERYVATLEVPETKHSPKRSKSILSLGNTSVISEAKGLWSTKDLNEDKLILEEITTIRKLKEVQIKPIDQNK